MVRVSATVTTLLWSALLTAQGATQLLASAVLPGTNDEAAPLQTRLPAAATLRKSPLELGRSVLSRNIFDSQTGSMEWDLPMAIADAIDAGAKETEARDPLGEPSPCTGSMRLVGSTVVPNLPDLSFASIAARGRTLLYRTGMRIERHEVVGIRERRVFLRPSDRPLCQIGMFVPPTSVTPMPPPPVAAAARPPDEKPPPPSKSLISGEELHQGITQISDTHYSVSRALLDKVLSAPSELMRLARVIPYDENGRVVGVKVYGIRRAGLLGKLGIQNGDILRTINGFDLSSPNSALEAYTNLREMDQLSIAMVRRGQPRTMEYSVK